VLQKLAGAAARSLKLTPLQ